MIMCNKPSTLIGSCQDLWQNFLLKLMILFYCYIVNIVLASGSFVSIWLCVLRLLAIVSKQFRILHHGRFQTLLFAFQTKVQTLLWCLPGEHCCFDIFVWQENYNFTSFPRKFISKLPTWPQNGFSLLSDPWPPTFPAVNIESLCTFLMS